MKLTALILAFIMLAVPLCLVSCNGDGGVDETTTTLPSDTTSEPTDSESPDEPSDTTTSEETTLPEEDTTQEDTTKEEVQVRDPSKPWKILFIGNSFTYFNNMPTDIFANICRVAGYSVLVDSVTKGGYFLYKFADPTDEYGKQVHQKLSSTKYDIVIIQDQSGNPVTGTPSFYDGARALAKLVEANGAELWLFETWGYKAGYSKLPSCGGTTEIMEMKLRAAYTAIAEELNANVALTGVAMLDVHTNEPSINLYKDDLYHPSIYGSTLVAWTIFAEIFGVDPRTINFQVGVSAPVGQILREAAYNAAFGDHPVADEYKLSSEGVSGSSSLKNTSDIDISKTVFLSAWPSSGIISYIVRNSTQTGNGWQAVKDSSSQTFSGIRGDKDAIASKEYSATQLTDAQKADIADIGYGVSVIGVEFMLSSQNGYKTAVENLVNGHWGSSYMAAMSFGKTKYNIQGNADENGEFCALITLNFGDVYTFDAIGYMSGSLNGFPQIQKVYVSDDGVNWTIVETACYDTAKLAVEGKALSSITEKKYDPWNKNKCTAQALFSMNGVSGKYIRIGVIAGRLPSTSASPLTINLDAIQDLNTREILVFGTKKEQ